MEVALGFKPTDTGVLRTEVVVGFNPVEEVVAGVPRVEVEVAVGFSPVDTGVLSVEVEVSSVNTGVLRVEVEASSGLDSVDTLVIGVVRSNVEVGETVCRRDSVLSALEVDVWFVNLRRVRAAYLAGGIGKLARAREIWITEDKSNKVTKP